MSDPTNMGSGYTRIKNKPGLKRWTWSWLFGWLLVGVFIVVPVLTLAYYLWIVIFGWLR